MSQDHQKLQDIFSEKYDAADTDWGGSSGPGSDPYFNIPYRAFLENFIRMNGVGSIVDLGCGDWQFSRYLDLKGVDYLGMDIAPVVVERNQARYGSRNVRFQQAPEDPAEVPGGDLLIMKDVLQHLSSPHVQRIAETVFPKFRFCLITNVYRKVDNGFHVPVNTDIPAGEYRCLDLTQSPFDLKGGYVLRFYTGVAEELRTLLIQN